MLKKCLSNEYVTWIKNYVYDNVVCLIKPIELITEDTFYFTTYGSLVVEIAESYGSWSALLFLTVTVFLLLAAAEQLIKYVLVQLRSYFRNDTDPQLNKSTNYRFFSKTYSFFNRK